MALVFDIEANGFLEEVTKIHCLVIKDTETKVVTRYNNQGSYPSLKVGIEVLAESTRDGRFIYAHNGVKYDIPVIKKLYSTVSFNDEYVRDTLVLSRLIYPDMGDSDAKLLQAGKLPPKLYKSHGLKAWGYRLGDYKDEYEGGWDTWSEEMEDYCEQDVHVLDTLLSYLTRTPYSEQAIQLEHTVARIIHRQQEYGFLFDQKKAIELYATLSQRRMELEVELTNVFTPRLLRDGKPLAPKKDNKARGYVQGAELQKLKLTTFNPSSRDHIAHWLRHMFGWKPTEFTDNGKPKVDETILDGLIQYPEAKLLSEYFMVSKRIGQLSEGDQAWFKHVKSDGRIHGSVITNGAVTGRMTHASPNMAQVPAGYSPYGHQCRELFTVPFGRSLVGADASALELRCLAGYMARYDEGSYIKTVTEGKKEDGTEIHTVNRKALEITSRDDAKTWFYAFIYGAGDYKLGTVLLKPDELRPYFNDNEKAIRKLKTTRRYSTSTLKELSYIHRGGISRDKFLKNLPALKELSEAVKNKAKTQGYLKGLDGRVLHVRAAHSALNTLLQSAGAVIMKQALVCLDDSIKALGLIPGVHYEFVANVHDEWQIECEAKHAETIGELAVKAMETAGAILNFRCPITGEYRSGSNWAETH